eukprot:3086856-Rhodomonas_salina.1
MVEATAKLLPGEADDNQVKGAMAYGHVGGKPSLLELLAKLYNNEVDSIVKGHAGPVQPSDFFVLPGASFAMSACVSNVSIASEHTLDTKTMLNHLFTRLHPLLPAAAARGGAHGVAVILSCRDGESEGHRTYSPPLPFPLSSHPFSTLHNSIPSRVLDFVASLHLWFCYTHASSALARRFGPQSCTSTSVS